MMKIVLADYHKRKRIGTALMFTEYYDKGGDKILHHIVNENETCILYFTKQNRHQYLEFHNPWKCPSSKNSNRWFQHAN